MLPVTKILAIVAGVFSIIELGLTAYLVSELWSSSRIEFMVFNSVWSLFVLAYVAVVPIYLTNAFMDVVAVALEVITVIFWFAGSIALAVLFRGCGGGTLCGSAKAAIVFGFLLWLLFTAMAVLDGLAWNNSRRNSINVKGPNAYPGA